MEFLMIIFIVGCMIITRFKVGPYKVASRSNTMLDLEDIATMDGFAFERLVAKLYEALGYTAYVTPESGDFGADVVLMKDNEKICIQCKRYKQPVGITAVQEVIGSLGYYHASKGMVVTNSTYTDSARKLARANGIELVDGYQLKKIIENYRSVVII